MGDAALSTSLLADQRRRWDNGDRRPVEHYLSSEPSLQGDTDALLDLIYAEVLLRREAFENPTADEYAARFPHLAEAIRTQFEVDALMDVDTMPTRQAPADPTPASPSGYTILEELGRGGMGVVYKARQRGLDRLVALKMIRSAEYADPTERARFETEARAVARLSHPNIVRVYDVGAVGGLPYLSLEYVDGPSLADAVKPAPFSPRRAAETVSRLARAVQHAHEAGVIHRDLKPANVLLDGDDPKVMDFGLAKRVGADTLTKTGDFLGTPSFAAPEQAAGRTDVGPGADIYSLGAILYQLLTGRPPFVGDSALETLDLVRFRDPPPPSTLRPSVPRDLETIALHCLRKEPTRRYPTAAALADDLDRFLEGRPISARPVGSVEKAVKWARRRPTDAASLALGALLVVVGLATTTVLWRRAESARVEEGKQRGLAEARAADALIVSGRLAWQTDDLDAALRAMADVPPHLRGEAWRALDRDCRAGRLLVSPTGMPLRQLNYDPAGRLVGFDNAGTLFIRDADTGEPLFQHARFERTPMALASGRDGGVVVAVVGSIGSGGKVLEEMDMMSIAPDGKRRTTGRMPVRAMRPSFSTDGRLAVGAASPGKDVTVFDVVAGKARHTLDPGGTYVVREALSPDGKLVLVAAVPRSMTLWDTESGKKVHTYPVVDFLFGGGVLAVTDDGRAFMPGGGGRQETDMVVMDRTGPVSRFFVSRGAVAGVACTADGKRVAVYAANDPAVSVWEADTGKQVAVFRGYRTMPTQITFDPTGKTLAAGYDDGRIILWTVPE